MSAWEGKRYEKYENKRMKELGVNMMLRKMGNSASPTVELTKSPEGKYPLSSNSTFKNSIITFKHEEEFDEVTLDGTKIKTTTESDPWE